MIKKVLVTGATGFIGNYVIDELLRHSCTVIASSRDEKKAEASDWFGKVKYIPFDLQQTDPSIDYYKFFDSPDAMIHLAWQGLPNYKNAFHIEENLPRHRKLLKNLIANGLRDLTVAGTCFEYGMHEGCLKEDMDAQPANAYAIAKNELRRSLEDMGKESNVDIKWPRLFYMYGKGQHPNSLFSQLDRALANGDKTFNMSGGEQVRDYLPVEQMAALIVKIALQIEVTGVINCCSGKPVVLKQLVEDYLKEKDQHISLNLGYYPYPDFEPMAFWGDTVKLNTVPTH